MLKNGGMDVHRSAKNSPGGLVCWELHEQNWAWKWRGQDSVAEGEASKIGED